MNATKGWRAYRATAILLLALANSASAQTVVQSEVVLQAPALDERDFYGRCVAISGDTLVVGANQDDTSLFNPNDDTGAVYVFTRAGSTWNLDVKLDAAPTFGGVQTGENFGRCVAISGDILAIGAPGNQFSPGGAFIGVDAGAVHVFERIGMVWTPVGRPLVPASTVLGDHFGSSVAVDGTRIVAGARFAASSGGAADAGRAYVFERPGTVWLETGPPLEASDAESFDAFGSSVAIDGTSVIVGAPMEDDAPSDNAGAAYVFTRVGTNWIEQQKLVPLMRCPFAEFGDCVSLVGNRAAVGAPFRVETSIVAGSVTIFDRAGVVWTEDEELFAADMGEDDRFGDCVNLRSDRLWVGAWNDRNDLLSPGGPLVATGSAYSFRREATAWVQDLHWTASNATATDRFGAAVAADGEWVVAGAWQKDDPSNLEGAAYAFAWADVTPVDLCSGDGGDQLGCTDCPCSNNAPPGTVGGCLNSVGSSARLLASGMASVSNDTLHFDMTSAPPTAFCILNSGNTVAPANMANPCFGLDSGIQSMSFDGLRCAIQSNIRHGGRSADGSGDVGLTNNGWGPPNNPMNGFSFQAGFIAGQSRAFQVIHREDALLSCMRGLNTTQASRVVFFP